MEDFKYFVRQKSYKPEGGEYSKPCLLHSRVGPPRSRDRIRTAFSFLYEGLKYDITCTFIDLHRSKLYTLMSENIGTELEKVTHVEVDILDPQLVAVQKWEI